MYIHLNTHWVIQDSWKSYVWNITPILALKIWRQIARHISTNTQCQSSERWIAPLHSVTEYQLHDHEVMDSSKARRQNVECSTASLVWVVGLTCFTRPSSNASIKCVQCVTCYQQSVVVLQFNMDQVKDKFLERLAIMEKDKKIILY